MADTTLRAYLRDIDNLIEREKLDEAIAHCRHILQTYPKCIECYRLLGKAYLEAKRYGDAADIFQRVLSAVPDDFVSHIGMSIVREDEGNLDSAIWHMERGFETNPANPAIQQELKRLIGRREGFEPHKVRLTRGALARMYAHGELYPQAIAELRSALHENSDRPDLQVLLAEMYWQTDQRLEAAEVSSQILDKLPYCQQALRIMAAVFLEREKGEEAAAYHRRLAQLDPYMAYITSPMAESTRVEADTIRIERLSWQPGQPLPAGEAPDSEWATALGLDVDEEEPAAEEPAGPLPSWLDDIEPGAEAEAPDFDMAFEAGAEEEAPMPEPELSQEPEAPEPAPDPEEPESAEIPEWMSEAGWEPSSGETEEQPVSFSSEELDTLEGGEPPPAQPSTEGSDADDEELAPAEMPDWIQGMAPPSEEHEDEGDEEELVSMLTQGEPEETDGGATSGIDDDGEEPAERSLEEAEIVNEVPGWIDEGEPGATSTIMAWLGDRNEPESDEATESADQSESDWMAEPEPEAEAEDEPDWMAEPEAEVEGEPDWMAEPEAEAEDEPDRMAEPEAEAEDEPDWMAEPEAEVEDEPDWMAEPEAEVEDEPDWMAESEAEVEDEPDRMAEPEAEAEDEPDWMAEPGAEEEPDWTAEPEAEAEDEPDWMAEPEAEEEPDWIAEPEAEAEEEPNWMAEPEAAGEEEEEQVPSWLSGVAQAAADAGAAEEEELAQFRQQAETQEEEYEQPEAEEPVAEEGIPSWLAGIADEDEPEEAPSTAEQPVSHTAETDELPSERVEEPSPDREASEAEEEAPPAWLQGFGSDTPEEVVATDEPSPPPEPAAQEAAAVGSEEEQAEDWLAELGAAADAAELGEEETEWLSQLGEEEEEEPLAAEAGGADEIPGWMEGLEEDEEPAASDVEDLAGTWLEGLSDTLAQTPAEPEQEHEGPEDWFEEITVDEEQAEPEGRRSISDFVEKEEEEEEEEDLGWLRSLDEAERMYSAEEPSSEESTFERSEFDDLQEDDVFEWLDDLASRQEAAEEQAEQRPSEEQPAAYADAEISETTAPEPEEEGLEWLEQLAESRGIDADVTLETEEPTPDLSEELPPPEPTDQPAPDEEITQQVGRPPERKEPQRPEPSEPEPATPQPSAGKERPSGPEPQPPTAEPEVTPEPSPPPERVEPPAPPPQAEEGPPEKEEVPAWIAEYAQEVDEAQAAEEPRPPAEPEPAAPEAAREPEPAPPEAPPEPAASEAAREPEPAPPEPAAPEEAREPEPAPPEAPAEPAAPEEAREPEPAPPEAPAEPAAPEEAREPEPAPPEAPPEPAAPEAAREPEPAPPEAPAEPAAPEEAWEPKPAPPEPAAPEEPPEPEPAPPAEPTKVEAPPSEPAEEPIEAEPEPPAEEAAPALETARQAMASGDHPEAAREYASLIEDEEWIQQVIDDLEGALKDGVDAPELWRTLGDAYVRLEQTEEAAKAYERGMTKDELLESAREALASGDHERATAQYGVLIKRKTNLDAVIDDLTHAAEEDGTPTLWQSLGDAYMKAGRLDDSIQAYRKGMDSV